MEILFYSISLALFLSAVLTFVFIIRDAFPSLSSEDQDALRNYWRRSGGFDTWRKRDRAIRRAWSEHAKRFPASRKRILFGSLLIAAAISLMAHPLWYALGPR